MFKFFGWLWKTVTTPIVTVVKAVVSTVAIVATTVVEKIVTTATKVVDKVAHAVLDPIGLKGVADIVTVAKSVVDNAVKGAAKIIVTTADNAGTALENASDAINSALKLDVGGVIKVAGNVLNTAKDIVADTVDGVQKMAYGTLTDNAAVTGTHNNILAPITNVTGAIIDTTELATNTITQGVNQGVVDPILGGVGGALEGIGDAISSVSFWTH